MDIDNIIRSRRSIRKYNDQPVAKETIFKIIEAGTYAPTACNKQEYRFIYFDDQEVIIKILSLGSASFLKNCRQAVLVLYDNRTDNTEYSDNIQSAAAVIQNMILKAHSLHIGTCWICNLPLKSRLRKLLDIPSYYDPVALVSLGNYDNEPNPVKRKHALESIVFINKYDISKDFTANKSPIKLFIRKIARKIYLLLPKTKLVKKITDKFEKKFDN